MCSHLLTILFQEEVRAAARKLGPGDIHPDGKEDSHANAKILHRCSATTEVPPFECQGLASIAEDGRQEGRYAQDVSIVRRKKGGMEILLERRHTDHTLLMMGII